jgi:hypothetical protein
MPVEFYEEYSWPRLFGWTPSIVEANGGIGRFDSESPLGAVRFTFDQMRRYLQRPISGFHESASETRERLQRMRDEADRLLITATGAVADRLRQVRDEADRLLKEAGGGIDDCFDATTGKVAPCGTPGAKARPSSGAGGEAPARADCGTFDVGCHLGNFFTSPTAKDVGKRIGLVLLAVVLLAVAIISLR